jgi:hypothetical protein
MAFKIEQIGRRHNPTFPPGFYIKKDSIWYQIESLNIDASGNVKMTYRDPIRKEMGILRICDIEELVNTIPDIEFERK